MVLLRLMICCVILFVFNGFCFDKKLIVDCLRLLIFVIGMGIEYCFFFCIVFEFGVFVNLVVGFRMSS